MRIDLPTLAGLECFRQVRGLREVVLGIGLGAGRGEGLRSQQLQHKIASRGNFRVQRGQ